MTLNDEIVIRAASISDIDFIIEGIIQAEKGGGSIIPLQSIVGLTLDDLKLKLKYFLMEDITDCAYSLGSYSICEFNGQRAGSIASWIEGENGFESSLIKMNLWITSLSRNQIDRMNENLKKVREFNLVRKKNYLQIEYYHIAKKFRKMGLHKNLFIHCINSRINNPILKGCQIFLFKENLFSYHFLFNRGFLVKKSLHVPDELIGVFCDQRTRISMEMEKPSLQIFLNRLESEIIVDQPK